MNHLRIDSEEETKEERATKNIIDEVNQTLSTVNQAFQEAKKLEASRLSKNLITFEEFITELKEQFENLMNN